MLRQKNINQLCSFPSALQRLLTSLCVLQQAKKKALKSPLCTTCSAPNNKITKTGNQLVNIVERLGAKETDTSFRIG